MHSPLDFDDFDKRKLTWDQSPMVSIIHDVLEDKIKENSDDARNIKQVVFPAIAKELKKKKNIVINFEGKSLQESILALFNAVQVNLEEAKIQISSDKMITAINSCDLYSLLRDICLPALKSIGMTENKIGPSSTTTQTAEVFHDRLESISKEYADVEEFRNNKMPPKLNQAIEKTNEFITENILVLDALSSLDRKTIEAAQSGYLNAIQNSQRFFGSHDESKSIVRCSTETDDFLKAMELQNQAIQEDLLATKLRIK